MSKGLAATGILGLDEILKGGLPRNHVYLIEGDPGTGKTTTGLQFLLEGVKHKEKGLFISFSESKNELFGVARSHGWNLDDLEVFEVLVEDESFKPENDYTMFHPDEVEMDQAIHLILAEIKRVNPQRIVFDSLSDMRMMARDHFRYRRQLLALKQFFTNQHACTVIFLEDRTMQLEGEKQLHSLAHGVITLSQNTREYGAKRRRLEVVKVRGHDFVDGFHDFDIQQGGVVVFPRIVAIQHSFNRQKLIGTSGIDELDELLGGGFDMGTSNIVTGNAGTGKTTLVMQYASHHARQGGKVAVYCFDESLATLIGRVDRIGMDVSSLVEDEVLMIKQIDPAEIPPGEFIHMVRESIEIDQASLIVIDSLNGYLNAMPEERHLVAQLHELFSYLNQEGILTLLVVSQPGLFGEQAQSPVEVNYLADTVVVLRYFEYDGRVKKAISVIKKRTGHHEKTIRELLITDKGIKLGDPLTSFSGILTGSPRLHGQESMLKG